MSNKPNDTRQVVAECCHAMLPPGPKWTGRHIRRCSNRAKRDGLCSKHAAMNDVRPVAKEGR